MPGEDPVEDARAGLGRGSRTSEARSRDLPKGMSGLDGVAGPELGEEQSLRSIEAKREAAGPGFPPAGRRQLRRTAAQPAAPWPPPKPLPGSHSRRRARGTACPPARGQAAIDSALKLITAGGACEGERPVTEALAAALPRPERPRTKAGPGHPRPGPKRLLPGHLWHGRGFGRQASRTGPPS